MLRKARGLWAVRQGHCHAPDWGLGHRNPRRLSAGTAIAPTAGTLIGDLAEQQPIRETHSARRSGAPQRGRLVDADFRSSTWRLDVSRAAEAHVARRAVGRAGVARGCPVPPTVRVVAEIGPTLLHLARASGGTLGIGGRVALPERGMKPVGRPLPDVAGGVVEAEPVAGERVDRAGSEVAVADGIRSREVSLPYVHQVLAVGLEFFTPREH